MLNFNFLLKNFLIAFFLFGSTLVVASPTDDFFKNFNFKNNLYVGSYGQTNKWIYDCKNNIDWKKGNLNVNDVVFDKKRKSIKFSFNQPDHPFYKVTKIVKKDEKNYVLYFQDKEELTNFMFKVKILKNNVSNWDFFSLIKGDDMDDQSFSMVSFNEKPQFKIINNCKIK